MSTSKQHYDTLLAAHYTWMFGSDFDSIVNIQLDLLHECGVNSHGYALDLGAGPGFQSFALARLGANKVIAIDNCVALLKELQSRDQDTFIEIAHDDVLNFDKYIDSRLDTVVCMGDTLTHLSSRTDINTLFEGLFAAMLSCGKFVVSYRDLSVQLHGLNRFFTVRSSDVKIMTCFLEYINSEKMMVHDLIHVRQAGEWNLHKSSYPKLILALDELINIGTASGFVLDQQLTHRGMHVLSFLKP